MNQKEFKVGDKVRIVPVWDGLPRGGTGVIMYVTPPGVETPEHVVVAAYGDAYRPSLCRCIRVARYFVRRDNPRDVDNPYLITCSTLPLELIDVIAPGHNPDDLTVKQVGERYILHRPKFIATLNRTAWNHVDRWNERFGVWEKVGGNVCYESSFLESETYRSEFSEEQLRILATSKKRLIRVDELPPVCWVMEGSSMSNQYLLSYRNNSSNHIGIGGELAHHLSYYKDKNFQWSSDLKTWNSFEVEDKQ